MSSVFVFLDLREEHQSSPVRAINYRRHLDKTYGEENSDNSELLVNHDCRPAFTVDVDAYLAPLF